MKPTHKAHLALLLVALIYASNYTIAKAVMPDFIQPFGFILMRVTAGMVVFSLVHFFFLKEKVEKKDFLLLAACAMFGVAINQMMFFKGLNWTTPIHAALIMTTTPILVLVASGLIIGELITKRKVLGVLVGMAGAIMLIAYGQDINAGSEGWKGDICVFINASSYGIYLVLVKTLMTKYHPLTVVKWLFTFGWFMVLPFGIGEFMIIDWSTFPMSIWLAVIYVLIMVTVVAYFLNAYSLKALNPSVVSTYIYLQPLLASAISLLAGKDKLSLVMIMAGILIFLGVYLVSSWNPNVKSKNRIDFDKSDNKREQVSSSE
ncbi:MAG: EamA family transporter [Bacteroidota bacterium]